ncbi:MAG: dUTP diphosphatase [Clostridia bacterium]|nr:dUTP diphosphatase [Clostridia bacterium]
MKLNVKILLSRGMTMPAYATDGSAAVDLRAAIDEGTTVEIAPGERALIPTGIAISPETKDVVAIVAARSGLAIKQGICLSNGIGVIDSDYRGEICVGLHNTSKVSFTVNRGDRIAQMMFMPVLGAQFIEVTTLDETERGAGGFGSTGVK